MNRIQELLSTTAFIFVSHSMAQITQVCTDVLLLSSGKVEFYSDDVGKGIENYFSRFSGNEQQVITAGNIILQSVELESKKNEILNEQLIIDSGETLTVNLKLSTQSDIRQVHVRIGIFNLEYRLVAEVDSTHEKEIFFNDRGIVNVKLSIDNLYLRQGKYYLHLHVTDANTKEKILRLTDIDSFLIKNTISTGADYLLPANWTLMTSE